MKKKELKELAKKIAKAELIIQTTNDKKLKKKAEEEIVELSGHVKCLDDILLVDEMVQDIIAQKI